LFFGALLTACAAPTEAPAEDSAESEDDLSACASSTIDDWTLHMKEDFDAWNDARWTKFDNIVPPNTKTCHVASNVAVIGGMLRIATQNESVCGGQPYTGGAISSYGKFWTGKYFKAEVRAKVSQEQGIFAAPLWFRPGNAAGATGTGGEIDVVESLGTWKTPKLQTTLHPDYSDEKPFVFKHNKYADYGDADGTVFHVYTVEKIPGGITFSMDGKFTAGWGCGNKSNEKRPAWFNRWFEQTPEGWSIRIDNKVGGGWAGDPDSTTRWGARTALYIDYIKVWKPTPR
jgi:hypothetical protein